jgi:acetyltransferase-like isoleucine patch superfamily enzyme
VGAVRYAAVPVSKKLRKVPWYLRYRVGSKVASEARRLQALATHLHCDVRFEGPVRIGPGFELRIPNQGTFTVGPGVDFRRGFVCEISGGGRVTIGAGSVFTAEALIQCTSSIEIGRRCALGQALLIADGNHHWQDHTRHMLDQGYDLKPITIGDRAVVFTKSTVTADIGEGAIVAANSFVNKPIPAYCLAGGVPARVLEYFGPPERRPADLDA